MTLNDKLTAAVISTTQRFKALAADERGDGPTDNSILIGLGSAAALVVTTAVGAAVAKYMGKI